MDSSNFNNLPVIQSQSEKYRIFKFLGIGAFGRVMRCRNERTKKEVAIKILNDCSDDDYENEKSFLHILKKHSEDYNFVRIFECFAFEETRCMAFELLDQSLLQFCEKNQMKIDDVRYVLAQLLAALAKLQQLGIIHTDLKMDNVMLVDQVGQPFRVKMIDFGNAIYKEDTVVGGYGQVRCYRAPEFMLGLPVTEKIDMWSLGCITARLVMNSHLYNGSCEYDQLRIITETQGLPPNHILNKGIITKKYFSRCNYVWRLKTPAQYKMEEPDRYKEAHSNRIVLKGLEEIANINTPSNLEGDELWAEKFSRILIVDLLKKMLEWDPDVRIDPDQALLHRATAQFVPSRILSEIEQSKVPEPTYKPLRRPHCLNVQDGKQQPPQVTGGGLQRPHPKPSGEKVRR